MGKPVSIDLRLRMVQGIASGKSRREKLCWHRREDAVT